MIRPLCAALLLSAAPAWAEAEAEGFAIERTVVEAQGLCPACRGNA